MATLTIRNLPDDVRDRLRVRAAEKGRSMEAEAREVLAEAAAGSREVPRASAEERVRRLQEAFAPYRSPQGSVVDELIAERRIEAWKETLESLQDVNAGKSIDWEWIETLKQRLGKRT